MSSRQAHARRTYPIRFTLTSFRFGFGPPFGNLFESMFVYLCAFVRKTDTLTDSFLN